MGPLHLHPITRFSVHGPAFHVLKNKYVIGEFHILASTHKIRKCDLRAVNRWPVDPQILSWIFTNPLFLEAWRPLTSVWWVWQITRRAVAGLTGHVIVWLYSRDFWKIYLSLFNHVILCLNTRSQHMCDATEFPVVLLRHTKIYWPTECNGW